MAQNRGAGAAHSPTRGTDVVSAFCAGVVVGLAVAAGDLLRRRPAPPPAEPEQPIGGWLTALRAAAAGFGRDRVPAAAAAGAFFVLLALFPAISAFVSLYGLTSNVADVRRQIAAMRGILPSGAITVVGDALTRLAVSDHSALSLAFFVSLAVSLWSANAGIKALMDGLNVAFEVRETRGFVRLNLESLALTLGAILLAMAIVAAEVYAPEAAGAVLGRAGALAARWIVAAAALAALGVASSLLYRFGPSRRPAPWRWITPGGMTAALGWVVMSAAFSWYVSRFGSYDRTYGSLGAVAGFITWVWLSLMVLLFGAELNKELESRELI